MARRYYTGRHLVLTALVTALVLFALFWIGERFPEPRKASVRNGEISDLPDGALPPVTGDDCSELLRETADNSLYAENERRNIAIYEKYNGSVVNITTQVIGYNWFLEPVPSEGASGSGAVIDAKGYILTNNHVVQKAVKVTVTFADGSQKAGEVVGTDPENDLAVIKIDPAGLSLTPIPYGDSDALKVGQRVLAIGNPYGLERTLTEGIVSGLGRPLKNQQGLLMKEMIQTDASINPGNSGGPLLNMRGELIGINTMIYSPSGGSVGIGFAVPVNTARRVVPDLISRGKVLRGWIEIIPVQLFPALVDYAGLKVREGILVSRVVPGGNAEKGGLRGGSRSSAVRYGRSVIYLGGDIITAIDGEPVRTLADYYSALENTRPGRDVTLSLVRDGKRIELDITLSERQKEYVWE